MFILTLRRRNQLAGYFSTKIYYTMSIYSGLEGSVLWKWGNSISPKTLNLRSAFSSHILGSRIWSQMNLHLIWVFLSKWAVHITAHIFSSSSKPWLHLSIEIVFPQNCWWNWGLWLGVLSECLFDCCRWNNLIDALRRSSIWLLFRFEVSLQLRLCTVPHKFCRQSSFLLFEVSKKHTILCLGIWEPSLWRRRLFWPKNLAWVMRIKQFQLDCKSFRQPKRVLWAERPKTNKFLLSFIKSYQYLNIQK